MRKDDGRVVPNFICQALRGDPITVYGDGSQTRSFCFVSDLTEGLIRAMERGDTQPVNLGSDSESSIVEFARLVLELTGSHSLLEYLPIPEDDPKVRRPDIARAKQLLGWHPQIDLRSGLDTTIDYFKNTEGIL